MDHPFTFEILRDSVHAGRFRWTLRKPDGSAENSLLSYPTRREAESDARLMLRRRAASWRLQARQ